MFSKFYNSEQSPHTSFMIRKLFLSLIAYTGIAETEWSGKQKYITNTVFDV